MFICSIIILLFLTFILFFSHLPYSFHWFIILFFSLKNYAIFERKVTGVCWYFPRSLQKLCQSLNPRVNYFQVFSSIPSNTPTTNTHTYTHTTTHIHTFYYSCQRSLNIGILNNNQNMLHPTKSSPATFLLPVGHLTWVRSRCCVLVGIGWAFKWK